MPSLRIPIQAISEEELSTLSRTSRWRAETRGWITRDYHTRYANVRVYSDPEFADAATDIYRLAQKCVSWAIGAGWPFAASMDRDDLVQECVIELWRCSGKEQFKFQGWRAAVMFRHLRRLRQLCRNDEDKFKRKREEEENER